MARVKNSIHFNCACGEKVEAFWKSKFPFGKKQWIAEKCRVCRRVKNLSHIEVIPCPNCRKVTLKGEPVCMECNHPLDVSIETIRLTCPNEDCELTIYLPHNYRGSFTCPICQTVISESEIHKTIKAQNGYPKPAELVELFPLSEMENYVIRKKTAPTPPRYPYGSRLQVYEGTYAVLVQNGVCQYPLSPGIHLLSEESKQNDSTLLDAAMQGENVIFNTEIFCVLKNLPEMILTLSSTTVQKKPVDDAPVKEYNVKSTFHLHFQVDDPKVFVTRNVFKEMDKATFLSQTERLGILTTSELLDAFIKAVEASFERYNENDDKDIYKLLLTKQLKEKLASLLSEEGLYLADITLSDLSVKETENSKQNTTNYKETTEKIETVPLPDLGTMHNDQLVISQYEKEEFQYKSRMQVSEGTYGLLLQNGICQLPPFMPGSHLLADCALDGVDRYNAAMKGENVVFRSTLFTVLKTLPAFEWYSHTTFTDLVQDGDAPIKEYNVRAQGLLRLQVEDAKKFAFQVGFRKLTVAELYHAHRPAGQLPSMNLEYEKNYPEENKDGWLYTRVKSILHAVFDGLCQTVFDDKLDPRRMSVYRVELLRRLRAEFDAQLSDAGLSVTGLDFSSLTAEETEVSKKATDNYQNETAAAKTKAEQQIQAREQLLNAAKAQFSWEARDVELHLPEKLALKACATFSGDCRLDVLDEVRFFELSEVRTQFEASSATTVQTFFKDKLQKTIANHLAHFSQEWINLGKIANPLDRYAYRGVADYVVDEIDRELAADGLKIRMLNIGIPDSITPSKELKDHLALSDRKEKIRGYAERKLLLKTDPILVHMKDDSAVFVKAVFSGTAYLRVNDEAVFFGTSEVKAFLDSEPFVSESAVNTYYTERINPLFADIISRIVQAIVDQTNADIRELHRLGGLLQSNVLTNLNDRVGGFGMRLDSLDMRMPVETERSPIMLTWVERNETRSGSDLQQEIKKLESDKLIFLYNQDNRVEIAKAQSDSQKQHELDRIEIADMESNDLVEEKRAELDEKEAARSKRVMDRIFQEDMDHARKQRDLNQFAAEAKASQSAFDYEEIKKNVERQQTLEEMQLSQEIREQQIRQQAEIDRVNRDNEARYERGIKDAENKRIVTNILHKIDESDLDWQQKLDEYARLQRKLAVDDQYEQDLKVAQGKAETQQVLAAADQRIKREENETYLLVGETKILLADEEVELLEKLQRYNEDRSQRIQDNAADRAERKASQDFERQMRDRKEQLAQDMELLKQKYDHELLIRDRDDKITTLDYEYGKLVFILDYLCHEMDVNASVEKNRLFFEAAIKKAEAQYHAEHEKEQLQAAENRHKERLRYDEEMAKHASSFLKMMAELQFGIEELRHETERNKDDDRAKVAIAQAENADKAASADVKRTMEKVTDQMDQRYRELQRAMDKIISSHKDLKEKVRDLTQPKQPSQPQQTAQNGQVKPKEFYGYSKDVLGELTRTGGLVDGLTVEALDKLAHQLRATTTAKATAAAPAAKAATPAATPTANATAPAASAPVRSTPAASASVQPGIPTQVCPHCRKTCSALANNCEHCGGAL